MSALLVIGLIVAAIVVVFFTEPPPGPSPFVARAAKVGGLAFLLYGFVLAFIYLMGLVKGG